MSDKLSVICGSILFSAIPAMLVYLVKSSWHDGYRPEGVTNIARNLA